MTNVVESYGWESAAVRNRCGTCTRVVRILKVVECKVKGIRDLGSGNGALRVAAIRQSGFYAAGVELTRMV